MATKVAETNPQRFSIKDNVQINRRNSVPLNVNYFQSGENNHTEYTNINEFKINNLQ